MNIKVISLSRFPEKNTGLHYTSCYIKVHFILSTGNLVHMTMEFDNIVTLFAPMSSSSIMNKT